MSSLLVKEKKGASWRLVDVETIKEFRFFERDHPDIDFIVGTLFVCEYRASGNYVGRDDFHVADEILGDSDKDRVEVPCSDIVVGDLVDGVPVVSVGRKYVKNGIKMYYAYFKHKNY